MALMQGSSTSPLEQLAEVIFLATKVPKKFILKDFVMNQYRRFFSIP